ncbi:preprotein translocase subunit SecE [Candidatus Phytoplasma tritici]|uniref:preprotein translocase subunit SecE n=1 Tax=Candidatus Phytoplasma tritici TaxID=321961 RepID=UPI0003FDC13D|nr:preprotein translocase subunit SecE [Candidatus Phytoplasma tritici]
MGIKIVRETKPNQLLEVIKREYSLLNILLIITSILSLALCGQLWQTKHFETMHWALPCALVLLSVFIFAIGSFAFFKDAFLQICNIIWPSLKQILFNALQVIFFTLFLILFVHTIDSYFIGKLTQFCVKIKNLLSK